MRAPFLTSVVATAPHVEARGQGGQLIYTVSFYYYFRLKYAPNYTHAINASRSGRGPWLESQAIVERVADVRR